MVSPNKCKNCNKKSTFYLVDKVGAKFTYECSRCNRNTYAFLDNKRGQPRWSLE